MGIIVYKKWGTTLKGGGDRPLSPLPKSALVLAWDFISRYLASHYVYSGLLSQQIYV